MEQKRVSFEAAKALKEAGYPQGLTMYRYVARIIDVMHRTKITHYVPGQLVEGTLSIFDIKHPHFGGIPLNELIDAPTYLDVWLWLWREKQFSIGIDCYNGSSWSSDVISTDCTDPEEAIEAAIKYLAKNKLLK